MQALWMVLGAFLFATMGVFIKYASEDFNSFEIVFYRGLVGVIFLIGLTRARGVSLRTHVPMMHLWRSVVGVTALASWFYAIGQLPLATAMTLNYMSSVWIATFLLGGAVLMQSRQAPIRQQGPLFVAVISGFIGVAMMLRPSFTHDQMGGALLGLLSGIFSAFAYLQVAALAKAGEPESRTVFYFSCGAVLVGAVGMSLVGVQRLDLAQRAVAVSHRHAGGAGAAVHDPRLRQRPHPGRGQPAVLGHRVCRHLQPDAVWRPACP